MCACVTECVTGCVRVLLSVWQDVCVCYWVCDRMCACVIECVTGCVRVLLSVWQDVCVCYWVCDRMCACVIECVTGCVRVLLSVWATSQAAKIRHGFNLHLWIVKFIPVNNCFYKKWILKLVNVGCGYIRSIWCYHLLAVVHSLRIEVFKLDVSFFLFWGSED